MNDYKTLTRKIVKFYEDKRFLKMYNFSKIPVRIFFFFFFLSFIDKQ